MAYTGRLLDARYELPWFSFPKAVGFTSGETVRVVKDQTPGNVLEAKGGYGVHLVGLTAVAAWTTPTRQLLASKLVSISLLELLFNSAAVVLFS